MNDAKYIGLDVHQATISVTVLDSVGKLVMEAILETNAVTVLQFIHGLRGSLQVTLRGGHMGGLVCTTYSNLMSRECWSLIRGRTQ